MLTRIVSRLLVIFFLLLTTSAFALPLTYAPAVKKAAPAVVNVYISHSPGAGDLKIDPDPGQTQFDPVLKDRMVLGSAVIMDQRGYILTNSHVIRDRTRVSVALPDGRTAVAKIIGIDTETDIAVLKINLPQLPAISMSNSDTLQVGDVVLAIGNPFGLGQTVTQGIISALGRTAIGLSNIENFIQTDVALNPGSSGGALINTDGQLIGINTGIYTHSGGYQGISFAIPINAAQSILKQIILYGSVRRGFIGIEVIDLNSALAQRLNVKTDMGVVVRKVLPDAPFKNEIQVNDVITAINGNPIKNAASFNNFVNQCMPGAQLVLIDHRGSKISKVIINLGAQKEDNNAWQEKKVRGKTYRYPDDRG